MAGVSFTRPGVYFAPRVPWEEPTLAPPEVAAQFPLALPGQSASLAPSGVQYPLAVPGQAPLFTSAVGSPLEDSDQETVINLAWELFFTSSDCPFKLREYFQSHLSNSEVLKNRILLLNNAAYKTSICWECTKNKGGTSWLIKNKSSPTLQSCANKAHSIAELFFHRLIKYRSSYLRGLCDFQSFSKCAASQQKYRGWECNFAHSDLVGRTVSLASDILKGQDWTWDISLLSLNQMKPIIGFQPRFTIVHEWHKTMQSQHFPYFAEHFFAKHYVPSKDRPKDYKLQFCIYTLQNQLCQNGKYCKDAHLPIQFYLYRLASSPFYKTKICFRSHEGIDAIVCKDVHYGEPMSVAPTSYKKRLEWPNKDYYEFEFHIGNGERPTEAVERGKKRVIWTNGNICEFTLDRRDEKKE